MVKPICLATQQAIQYNGSCRAKVALMETYVSMRGVLVAFTALVCVSVVRAEVVIKTVTVGNPGNAGELSGRSAFSYPYGYGPNRICGAVEYTYNIGKYEVTAGQYTEFLNAVAANDPYGLYNTSMWTGTYGCKIERTGTSPDFSYSVARYWADRPVNYVSWGDAARFANWLHNGQPTGAQDLTTTEDGSYYLNGATSDSALIAVVREPDATFVIPSEDEWYKAAFHKNDGVTGNYYDFATQADCLPTIEPPPGTDMVCGSANYWDNGFAVGAPYYRTEVGSYDANPSDSAYGTYDQAGNVWEFNESIPYGSYRGVRGGSFYYWFFAMHAAWRSYGNGSSYEDYTIGFRIAKVPQVKSDIDFDGDVDLDDYALLHAGDLHDYARFQVAFSGAQ